MAFSRWFVTLTLSLLGSLTAFAQQYVISTYAGGAPPPTPTLGTIASIGYPVNVATDTAGNVYFASDDCVFKLEQNGVLTRVAGNSRTGYSGDGGPATGAQLSNNGEPLGGVAVDSAGNLYIADIGNNRIRKVNPAGIISTIAGNGSQGDSGDGGEAVNAQLNHPAGVAVDNAGNVYIAGSGNEIRKVTPAGMIGTVAGNGSSGYSGDGGLATSAQLNFPVGVAVDGAGNLYIADNGNNRIRKVIPSGIISTIAGNGSQGYSGDGGPATSAQLNFPVGVAVDSTGTLYIADTDNQGVRKVTPAGMISTIAGNGSGGYSGDGGSAAGAQLSVPNGVAVDNSGNLYIADFNNTRIRKVTATGVIGTVAGNGNGNYSGDGGSATSAQLSAPDGLAMDNAGNLYIVESRNSRVRKVTPAGIIGTVAGNGSLGYSGDGGPATSAQLYDPVGVTVDGAGNLYIADGFNNRVRKVTPAGIISTIAGTGSSGYSGDGGPATSAQLYHLGGLTMDSAGNLYVADTGNSVVRKVTPAGIISTIAGNGSPGYSGDGGPAAGAQLRQPDFLALDSAGNLYIADTGNSVVRKVTPGGVISTIAGNGRPGYSGDGGPATGAQLNFPQGIAVDSTGNLYITDQGNELVRMVTPAGIIGAIAGNGDLGYSGDGGPATGAQFYGPSAMAVDGAGKIYVADSQNNAIRLLTLQSSTAPIAPTLLSGGIVPAYSSVNTIQPGEWISIYGANLTSSIASSSWNGTFTTSLGGMSATIDGKPAYLSYAGPNQINLQSPDDTATGAVTVVVTTPSGTATGTVTLAQFAPSFLLLDDRHVAGIILRSDGSGAYGGGAYDIIGPTGNSLGYATVAAKPGDIVSLYAVGLGPTTPTVHAGQQFSGAAPTDGSVSVLIDSVAVTPSFAGLSGAGLYQINLTVPAGLGTNDVPLLALVGGAAQTQSGVMISLK